MRIKYNENQSLVEMAIINPKFSKSNIGIQVEIEQRNEGPIPHLHVYLDKTRNPKNCAYVRLDKAEYMPNHDSIPLTGSKKKEFIELMNQIWRGQFVISIDDPDNLKQADGYSGSVQIWNDTYEDKNYSVMIKYDNEGFPIMPDYNKL